MSDSNVGRNEPCPCGSGKKYKRCHGVNAAPKLSAPSAPVGMPAGLPSGAGQMDPAMMMQLSQAFQKLPRAQMQKFQNLMQRAMAGQDVTREAEILEKTLPPEFKSMMEAFAAKMPVDQTADAGLWTGQSGQGLDPGGGEMSGGEMSGGEMSVDDARRIVEEAVAAGQLSRDQADALLNPKG